MKKIIITSILAASALFASEANATKQVISPVVKEGVGYIKMLGKELKTNMKKHMMADKSGIDAAGFCSNKASDIAKEVSKKFPEGVRVYRTSLKIRNEANKPDAKDKEILEQLAKSIEDKTFKKKPTVVKLDNNKTRVYVPLIVEKACTVCHGDAEKINPEIKKIIASKYPNDKAVDFKEGSLRGVIVAEMPTKK